MWLSFISAPRFWPMGMAAGTALGTGTGGIKVAPGSETMVAACRRSRACAAGLFLCCRGFEGFGLAEMLGAQLKCWARMSQERRKGRRFAAAGRHFLPPC